MNFLRRIAETHAPSSVILIRLLVGAVFLSEGIQKFINPAEVGAGRFAKIGLPNPDFLATLVGTFEIVCGILVLLGLLTRIAAVPLSIIILTAILSTKILILFDKGFWAFAHETRTDWSMLLSLIFLILVGAGRWSLDSRFSAQGRDYLNRS